MPGHAQTDWFDLARALTDRRLGGTDPQAVDAARLSPDMGLDDSRTASTPAATPARVSSVPPSIIPVWLIWIGCAGLCLGVWFLVVYVVLVLA